MIPKKIHYCWFGRGEKPAIIKKCIKSWKKYCPDYEIIEWNEDNFDINGNSWTKQAYENKKYAFVADFVRLDVLQKYGGIYFDTDQELLKNIDSFLSHKMFLGFQNPREISAGIIGAVPNHELVNQWKDYYVKKDYVAEIDSGIANTVFMDETLHKIGMVLSDEIQYLDNVTVYPQTYFCPTSCLTVENCISENTVSIHHFMGSWRTEKGRRDMQRQKFHSTLFYRVYEQIAAYPIALYKKIFKK